MNNFRFYRKIKKVSNEIAWTSGRREILSFVRVFFDEEGKMEWMRESVYENSDFISADTYVGSEFRYLDDENL